MADKGTSYLEMSRTVTEGAMLLFQFKLKEALQYWRERKDKAAYCQVMNTMVTLVEINQANDKPAREALNASLSTFLEEQSKLCHFNDDLFSSVPRPNALQMQSNPVAPVIAFTLFLKAGMHGLQDNYIRAAKYVRKCWKYYEECYKIVEEYKGPDLDEDFICDTIFGAGLFYFVMSLIPPAWQWLAEVVGFTGDRKKGWTIINRCAKRKSFVGFLASCFMQTTYQWYFQDYEAALTEYESCRKNFPDATGLLWIGASALRQTGKVNEANALYQQLIEASTQMKQINCSLHYELGSSAIKCADWPTAIKNLEYYLKESPNVERTTISCYELGMCYACAGDVANAKKYFALALERHKKDADYEKYSARKSQEFLDKGANLSNTDKVLYEMRQRMTTNSFAEILKLLPEKVNEKDLKTPDERAVYNYIMGACYHKTNDTEKAFKCLISAYKEKAPLETWVQPFCMVECSELEIKQKNNEQAKKALETAKNFKDYNFQSELSQRISRVTDLLNGVDYKRI